jgi:hypothetical protein
MEQDKVTFGTEKLILSHKEMKYGTEQGHFLGQDRLTYGHNETNFGTERGDFLGHITNPHMDWVKLEIATFKFWDQKTVV